jgi:uncharacterized protein (TIGR00299 family) protein
MRVAYFDCFSGASGDMILGALIDAGLDVAQLRKDLGKLQLTGYDLKVKKVTKKGIAGTQALVMVEQGNPSQPHRHLSDIRNIIEESDLEKSIKEKGMAIFGRLAEAEAKVHNEEVDHIHFHEVGAIDSIVDVIGAVSGLAALGIEEVFCSPIHIGTGTVECAHGTLPVPAPATMEILRGIPVYSTGLNAELLTPTGAAVLMSLSSAFGPMPSMTIQGIGYGAGTSDLPIPNLLRLIIGELHCRASFSS